MLAFLLAAPVSAQLPELVLRADDTELTASCRVVVPEGLVLADDEGDGVLHVLRDGITVEFAEGSVLRGAPAGTPLDLLEGVGIRVEGARGVTLRGVRAEGFRCAVLARQADGLTVEDGRFARNFGHRLRSTPEAEDGADWLWPHQNDAEEWRRNYGAAVSVHRSSGVVLRRNVVRAQQNGLLLDRVEDGRVYDNDCSFLSGWGLAMWRSSGNLVSRNAFDFCIRGYSHGVYNRGQDSAGILLFEQCSRNHFLENSATHGGDGVFGFGGREALGEAPPPRADFDHQGKGCNANWFVGNDFSYAAAHGLELTFSFQNRILDNRFAGNAICGMWLGFSQDTLIARNDIEENGGSGYGLERGGINIDHSRANAIVSNRFTRNACGVHLWRFPGAFADKPWGRANRLDGAGNLIASNSFVADRTAIHLRGGIETALFLNQFASVPQERALEGEPRLREAVGPLPVVPEPRRRPEGETRPVGARRQLAGRERILMGEWGPWDHERPLLYRLPGGSGAAEYLILPPELEVEAKVAAGAVEAELVAGAGGRRLRVAAAAPGWTEYEVEVRGEGLRETLRGSLLAAAWELAVFDTPFDPREDAEAWARTSAAALATATLKLTELRLPYAGGGPADLPALRAAAPARTEWPGSERFGTVARTRVRLPEGRWRVRTTSDDGVRVRVSTQAEPVIDNWTWHGPTEDLGEFEVGAAAAADPSGIEIFVEHFELDGYAILSLELEPVR